MNEAKKRLTLFENDELPYRALEKPIYKPRGEKVARDPEEWSKT